jgi:hypothetical protein
MAPVLSLVFQHGPGYTLSMAPRCLRLGPVLATGLYEVSRRQAHGHRSHNGLICEDDDAGCSGLMTGLKRALQSEIPRLIVRND